MNAEGQRKLIGEVYPSRELLEVLFRSGVTIVLSSDAHAADQYAMGDDKSVPLVREVGYREVATFKDRERGTLAL